MTNSENATIGWPVYRDLSTLEADATFRATTQSTGYPASHLGTFPLHYVWRSEASTPGNVPDEELTATFDSEVELGTIALIRHNGSVNATWRVRLYQDGDGSVLLWDSGAMNLWPAVYTEDEVTWDGGNFWDRTYSSREREGQTWHQRVFVPELYFGRLVKVTLSDPDNQDGYFQVGLLEVAGKRAFSINPEYGAEFGFRGRTEVQEADGGTKIRRRRPKPRVFNGAIPFLPEDEAMGVFFELLRQNDVNVPFFWSLDPTDDRNYLRNDYMAHLADLGLMSYSLYGRNGIAISIEEEL